jgi:hypothetical protein
MPIRWSAVSVSEAMDKVDKEIEPIFEPLWRADAIVREAMNLPNIPDYMKQALLGLQGQIHMITGYDLHKRGSRLLDSIHYVSSKLPEGSVEAEKHAIRHGKTGSFL